MRIEVGGILGIPSFKIDEVSDEISMITLLQKLDDYFKRFHLHPRYVLRNTNRPLSAYSTAEQIKGGKETIFIGASVKVLGGKGGFGATLRANKNKSGKQPKREVKDGKTYYKDLKTGVKVKDIKRLKKAYETLNAQDIQTEQEKEKLQLKKKKLEKAIGYYESMLNGSAAAQDRFQDTEFLDELEDLMMEMRDSVNQALLLESESERDEWESDWESSEEEQKEPHEESSKDRDTKAQTNTQKKPKAKFASFFEENDDEY